MAGRFNAGDTVVCTVDHPANNNFIMAGDTGTVVACANGIAYVDWGRYVGGHSCGSHCHYGNGWNVGESKVELWTPDAPFDIQPSEIDSLFQEVIT